AGRADRTVAARSRAGGAVRIGSDPPSVPAAHSLTPVVLECGGKDARLVAADAAATSASAATSIASLPPHSSTTGVRDWAACAITFDAVPVDPVNATLSTPVAIRSAPTAPLPVTVCSTGCSGLARHHNRASSSATPGVNSLGLNTTALPVASAYQIEPPGVNNG